MNSPELVRKIVSRSFKKTMSFNRYKKSQYELYVGKGGDKAYNLFCMNNKLTLREAYEALIEHMVKQKLD